jgi:hypothetical protein
MLVPRSFKYSCPPPTPIVEHKSPLRNTSRDKLPATPDARQRPRAAESRPHTPPHTPPPTTSDEMMRKPSRPVDVPSPEKARFSGSRTVGHAKGRSSCAGKRKDQMPAQHRGDALSPSVAALLAMTTIPRRPRQTQRRPGTKRQVSIDELVNEWKSDDSLAKSYESSPMSILLESADEHEDARSSSLQSDVYQRSSYERSESSDSVPSLEGDAHSMFSLGSLATPGSMRSRKSSMTARKESPRTLSVRECCAEDHPLISLACDDDDVFDFAPSHELATANKSKSSFKSNLTTSLQALKLAALSPFTPRKAASSSTLRSRRLANKAERAVIVSPLSDDVLWSHPFLFPRFSHEVRPDYKGTPTTAQRRYLNPIPLSFEEQEAPFQQALHAPYLAEQIPGTEDAPTIQMQTYSRSGSRGGKGKNSSNKTDAEGDGTVVNAAVASAMRQREPRENSDFLRVVVLEMNMRREGKLEMGRAKIWLPPRQNTEINTVVQGKVPRRWIGESAT